MYEATQLSGGRQIPAQVFLSLSEAGFNLATSLGEGATVEGIVADHPEILSGEIDNYDKLAAILEEAYGKKKVEAVDIADLEKEVTGLKEQASTVKGLLRDAALQMIEEKEGEIHSHRLTALANLATALTPFLGRKKEWAKQYASEMSENHTLTAQRYKEAVKFAEKLAAELAGE